MDHLGPDEQFELLTFTLVHTRQSGAFLGSFFLVVKKIWKPPGFFPWVALGWAVQNFLLYYYFMLVPTLPFMLAVVIFFFGVVVLRVY